MGRGLALAVALLAALFGGRLASAADERLAYEITETAPGSRSQGWHGVLYDRSGTAIEVEVGKAVMSDVGELTSVAKTQNWVPYGMIPTEMLRWMEGSGKGNVIMGEAWSYRLYLIGEDTRCPSWRGELLRDGSIVAPAADGPPVLTPMGPFISGPHGFAHTSWKVRATVRCG
jgi:hypothetical protein